jgi:undecaprenyl-diphosphatase
MPPGTGEPDRTLEDALAQRVEARRGAGSRWAEALRVLGAADRGLYEVVARTPTAGLDVPVRRLSNAANHSLLWLGIATAIALLGGARGRRAAAEGIVSIGVASTAVNLGMKRIANRRRPGRQGPGLFPARHVRMPGSSSFPSGHAASAFAFAYGVSRHLPELAVPIGLLAGAVAYSRVHTGVHYPGDVVVGAIVGTGTAATVGVFLPPPHRSP